MDAADLFVDAACAEEEEDAPGWSKLKASMRSETPARADPGGRKRRAAPRKGPSVETIRRELRPLPAALSPINTDVALALSTARRNHGAPLPPLLSPPGDPSPPPSRRPSPRSDPGTRSFREFTAREFERSLEGPDDRPGQLPNLVWTPSEDRLQKERRKRSSGGSSSARSGPRTEFPREAYHRPLPSLLGKLGR